MSGAGIAGLLYGIGNAALSEVYHHKEGNDLNNAYRKAQPNNKEQYLVKQQGQMAAQALKDRRATRAAILTKMGLKLGPDGSIQRMSPAEQEAAMGELNRLKTSTMRTYNDRAQAAAKGETKLPSFLKKEIDHEAEKESALLKDMFGENSTALQQAIAARSKGEESLRGQIQDQDLALAPGMAQELSGQMLGERDREISALNELPNQNLGLMRATAAILNSMQKGRVDQYNKDLKRIKKRRDDFTLLTTGGGLLGGYAATKGDEKDEEPIKTVDYTPRDYGMYNTGYGGYRY